MVAAKTTRKKAGPKKSGSKGTGKAAKRAIEHVVIIVKENHGRARPIPRIRTRTTGTTRG